MARKTAGAKRRKLWEDSGSQDEISFFYPVQFLGTALFCDKENENMFLVVRPNSSPENKSPWILTTEGQQSVVGTPAAPCLVMALMPEAEALHLLNEEFGEGRMP